MHLYYRYLRQPGSTGHSWMQAVLAVLLLTSAAEGCSAQSPAKQQVSPLSSLAQTVENAKNDITELHIFYIHGIGINPPKEDAGKQVFKVSKDFQEHFCQLQQLHCTSKFVGRSYANRDLFAPNKVPDLRYLGTNLWANNDEWNASAPFVDHYELLTDNGKTIHLHEINWWPLVMAAKCRRLVAWDAALVDDDNAHLSICEADTQPDKNERFTSYRWLNPSDVPARKSPWPKAAAINRWAKHDLLDWSFTDALLAVGPLHQYLVEGIREVVLDSYQSNDKQEFIIVSHSLGSYLMFSALDLGSDTRSETPSSQKAASMAAQKSQSTAALQTNEQWQHKFDDFLRKTSHAYFMANQLSLLELANLDESQQGIMSVHLAVWGQRRAEVQKQASVVAFSDPDDLLTWQLPAKDLCENSVIVHNVAVLNTPRWLGFFANPDDAHVHYDRNKNVLDAMFPKQDLPACQ